MSYSRSVQQNVTSVENNKQSDLLGLSNGEDNFTSFLSAPTKEEKKPEESDPAKSEEESFFNQTIPVEKEKVKLTKDSILALYGNTPQNNFPNVYQNTLGQVPYQANYVPQGGFQNMGTFPQTNYPVQNGLPQYPVQQQFANQQWPTMPQANVQYIQGQSAQFPAAVGQFATPQFPANVQFQSAPGQFSQLQQGGFGQTPNPFTPGQTNNLQQQFGNLSLNNQTNGASTLATNLWQ